MKSLILFILMLTIDAFGDSNNNSHFCEFEKYEYRNSCIWKKYNSCPRNKSGIRDKNLGIKTPLHITRFKWICKDDYIAGVEDDGFMSGIVENFGSIHSFLPNLKKAIIHPYDPVTKEIDRNKMMHVSFKKIFKLEFNYDDFHRDIAYINHVGGVAPDNPTTFYAKFIANLTFSYSGAFSDSTSLNESYPIRFTPTYGVPAALVVNEYYGLFLVSYNFYDFLPSIRPSNSDEIKPSVKEEASTEIKYFEDNPPWAPGS